MGDTASDPDVDPSDEDVVRRLESVSADLTYPSESDEPFEAFCWKATEQDVLKQILIGKKAGAQAVETSLDDFFAELICGEDGRKFAQLRNVIESQLTTTRVLRIDGVEVDVYLVGRTPTGKWAGLHTTSVET